MLAACLLAIVSIYVVRHDSCGLRMIGHDKCALWCRYVAQGLSHRAQDAAKLQRHMETVEDTETLRHALAAQGLVALVGNGATLPRCRTCLT